MARPAAHVFDVARTVGVVARIQRAHSVGAWVDAAYDGGEWSGPAHGRAEAREVREAVQRAGYTMESFGEAVASVMPGGEEFAYQLLAGLDDTY